MKNLVEKDTISSKVQKNKWSKRKDVVGYSSLMRRRSFLTGMINLAGATTGVVASARLMSGIAAGGGVLTGLSQLVQAADSIQEHTVEIHNLVFVPEVITVCPGDKIRWINRDISPHTATALDGRWDTQELALNQHRTLIVTKAMAGEYYCLFHPHMKGEIRLRNKEET